MTRAERNLRHAQMLAGIAAQVAASYRAEPETHEETVLAPSTTSHDPSWDFRLPEEYRG